MLLSDGGQTAGDSRFPLVLPAELWGDRSVRGFQGPKVPPMGQSSGHDGRRRLSKSLFATAEIRKEESSGREWTIGVEFDESSLLNRAANVRRVRKMTGRKVDPLTEEFECQSISLSPRDPFILGDLDIEGESVGG
ncbi:hypothetical protein KM043_008602 [Ampulex compressa]|nr:hypothetical protein KM043_008602 [Ampulex compressa]